MIEQCIKVYKLNLYYFYTLIFYFMLYFSCLDDCVGNFALGCEPGTDYPSIQIFQCMPELTDVKTNEILETITFVLA